MEIASAHIPMALEYLGRRGYQDAHAFVPHARAIEPLVTLLQAQGMARIDNRLAHFYRTTEAGEASDVESARG